MRASVATTPRTVSSANRRSIASPSGRATRSRQTSGSAASRIARSVGQRLEQGRGDDLREPGDVGVEGPPGGVLVVAAGEVAERRAVAGPSGRSTSRPPGFPLRIVGCVRRGGPRRQLEVEAELGDEPLRQQRDEVGVARQPRGVAGEGHGRHGGTAGVGQPLEDQDRRARPGPGRPRQLVRCALLRPRSRHTLSAQNSPRQPSRAPSTQESEVAPSRALRVSILLAAAFGVGWLAVISRPDGVLGSEMWPAGLAAGALLAVRGRRESADRRTSPWRWSASRRSRSAGGRSTSRSAPGSRSWPRRS